MVLNGGTLITSGTISGGAGVRVRNLRPNGAAAGDAVQFGTLASTLVVKPHAVFNGQVAANASVNDVLRLSGIQSGGTPITLGTQFTNFSTLAFAFGAAWTVDVGTGAAPSGGLAITGFTTSDTIDVTNLSPTQVASEFNPHDPRAHHRKRRHVAFRQVPSAGITSSSLAMAARAPTSLWSRAQGSPRR